MHILASLTAPLLVAAVSLPAGATSCSGQPDEHVVAAGAGPGDPAEPTAVPPRVQDPKPAAGGGATVPGLHGAFDAILRATVRDERVDYLAIRDRHRAELERYLDRLAAVDPTKMDRPAALAYWLNLYNATMVHVVVARLSATYSPADDGYTVFDEKLARTHTGKVSLNEIENEIIRKRFDEPRIHVGLVCGARSCPPLQPVAFTGENVDVVLQNAMTAFVNDSFRNRLDGKSVKLSQIFNWYKVDFGDSDEAVVRYIDPFTEVAVRGKSVEYLEYSWALNIAVPDDGEVVQIVAAGRVRQADGDGTWPVRKGQLYRVVGRDGDDLRVRLPSGDGTLPAKLAKPWRADS